MARSFIKATAQTSQRKRRPRHSHLVTAVHFADRQTAKGGGATLTDKSKVLLYSVENSVARLTLNRPEKRNALNDELIEALKDTIRAAVKVESVRVILIGG